MSLENLRLVLLFMKGDNRIFDGLRWSFSINAKLTSIGILYEEVLREIPKTVEEFKNIEQKGIGSDKENLILSTKIEAFFNSIYALCENLSQIAYQLFCRKIPMRFHDQRKKVLDNTSIAPEYSELLKRTGWYDQVHSLRSEATHFLSGLIIVSEHNEIGYSNLTKSEDKTREVNIDNIETYTKETYQNLLEFLSEYGNFFVKVINQDFIVTQTCCIIPKIGVGLRKISLREALNGEEGKCETPNFNCPARGSCKAVKT